MFKFCKSVLLPVAICTLPAVLAFGAPTVPTEVEQPGTQPLEIGGFAPTSQCGVCHGNTPNPDFEPYNGWLGGMMSQAARDPLFWAALAVAEQDYLPNADPSLRGGVGDQCLRCHMPNGWTQGRAVPTDGSAMDAGLDVDGVECEFCHKLLNPDPPVNVTGTIEVQNAPYLANDGTDAYSGSGMFVINGNDIRVGPYDSTTAPHSFAQSALHRSGDMCGTCHDVSNPVVGDLAHNNGSHLPLDPMTFSGDPSSPLSDKAQFNNPPHKYGNVERTYSEWKASGLDDLLVNDFSTLPAELKTVGTSIQVAYSRAWRPFNLTANYVDGTPRYFTCQTCHMSASTGEGCGIGNPPLRVDLPRHDQTGGSYWAQELIQYMDDQNTLTFGGGISSEQRDAMDDAMLRAGAHLESAALLDANVRGNALAVRVTNVCGHKLTSGYPEGRRLWLNVKWYNGLTLIHEDGAYGPIGRTVDDLDSTTHAVSSLIDPDGTVVFGSKPGIDQEWADQLLGYGVDSSVALTYDRLTDAVTKTMGQLAADPPGTADETFHLALNNVVIKDTRIPPYQMDYDQALERNASPVPLSSYGNPGPGGVYDHFSVSDFEIPVGATRAEVRLFFQQATWEYIQFLWLANDQQNAFLADEGENLLDGWLNTGQSPPFQMSLLNFQLQSLGAVAGEASVPAQPIEQLQASYNDSTGKIDVEYTAACDATDHTIHFGDLDNVSTYGYDGTACHLGTSGSASFDPGPSSVFFLVAGNDTWAEGSYGRDSDLVQRPPATVAPGCSLVQDLSATCLP